jgi:hypothetical protein
MALLRSIASSSIAAANAPRPRRKCETVDPILRFSRTPLVRRNHRQPRRHCSSIQARSLGARRKTNRSASGRDRKLGTGQKSAWIATGSAARTSSPGPSPDHEAERVTQAIVTAGMTRPSVSTSSPPPAAQHAGPGCGPPRPWPRGSAGERRCGENSALSHPAPPYHGAGSPSSASSISLPRSRLRGAAAAWKRADRRAPVRTHTPTTEVLAALTGEVGVETGDEGNSGVDRERRPAAPSGPSVTTCTRSGRISAAPCRCRDRRATQPRVRVTRHAMEGDAPHRADQFPVARSGARLPARMPRRRRPRSIISRTVVTPLISGSHVSVTKLIRTGEASAGRHAITQRGHGPETGGTKTETAAEPGALSAVPHADYPKSERCRRRSSPVGHR